MKKYYIKTHKINITRTVLLMSLLTVHAVSTASTLTITTKQQINDNIFQVLATSQTYIPTQPWQKNSARTSYGYGINIGNGRILTTEHMTRNHNLIELRREQRGEKIEAKVLVADPQVNLAILEVINPPADWPQQSQTLLSEIKLNTDLTILQFDENYKAQHSKAELISISISSLPNAQYSSLSFKLLTDLNVNGEGVPVMKDGNLAGLMISYNDSKRTGYMIPYPVIKRFLENAQDDNYTGFATSGFSWRPLMDPTKRAFLGAPRANKGVQVLRCSPESGAFNVLQQNDVIIELDNHKIDSLGFYNDPEFGRLNFSYIIKGHHVPDDVISAKIVRKGKELEVKLPLKHITDCTSLIPENIIGERPEYMVQGGMVICELSGRYLKSYGNKWKSRINTRLVQYYQTRGMISAEKDQHFVILAKVLPHPINVGYQGYANRIITAVNSQPINNMADVFKIVDTDGGLESIRLQDVDIDFVLDKEKLDSANADIIKNYGIPALKYKKEIIQPASPVMLNNINN